REHDDPRQPDSDAEEDQDRKILAKKAVHLKRHATRDNTAAPAGSERAAGVLSASDATDKSITAIPPADRHRCEGPHRLPRSHALYGQPTGFQRPWRTFFGYFAFSA